MVSQSEAPTESKLSAADRLSGVLFQFIQLYERLSEDRQTFIAQVEKLDAVLKLMSVTAKAMSEFKPQVNQAVEESLRRSTNRVLQVVLDAVEDLKHCTDRLNPALGQAESLLERYQLETIWSHWKNWLIIGLTTIGAGAIIGLLVTRLIMPTFSLTDAEAEAVQRGETFALVWPSLSPAEQKHYEQLAKKVNSKKPGK
jgi:hypothetical protein